MSKKMRTILFLICLLLFILVVPSVVFYSQGYRFDSENKKISQTGGLFLKVLPKQVEVYLDGRLKKKTDFFFGSILIENLLPKKYKIEVKKEGYHLWEKILEIKEKEVTEAKNIILFPENLNFQFLSKGVENFWLSPDQKKIVLLEEEEKSWALKLYELEKNVKSHLIYAEDISPKEVDLLNLEFSSDSKSISLEVGVTEQNKYFEIKIDEVSPILTEKDPPPPPPNNILAYQEFNNDIYYLDNFGYVLKTEGSLTSIEKEPGLKITDTPFPVKQEIEYKLKIFLNYIFLEEGKTLYKLNTESKSFERFFEEIRDLKISPSLRKLVYFSDYEIWILFLKEEDQLQKKAGEKLFLVRLSEKIDDVFWLNSDYLVFNAGNKIKIAEIDPRDKINIIDIFEIKNLPQSAGEIEIFWNKIDKKLYILSKGNLYYSGILLF